MTALLIPFLFFSHTWCFPLLLAALSALAAYEIQHCIGCHTKWYAAVPSYAIGVLTVLLTRYTNRFAFAALTVFAVGLFFLLCASVFSQGAFSVSDACQLFAMTAYAAAGFAAVILLRDARNGAYLFVLPLGVPWTCDTFAYFTGHLFGKHKLIPAVSPKKTVEGAVGGIVFGTAFLVLYGFLVGCFGDLRPRYAGLVLIGVILTVVSQCGDLVASQLKRAFGIKDYGKLLPGHGGVMDRVDSLLFSSVVWHIFFVFCIGG